MSELPPSVVRGTAPREGEAVGVALSLARQLVQWHQAGRWHGQVGVRTVTFDYAPGPRLTEPEAVFRLGDSAGDWERLPSILHDRLPLELSSDLSLARRRLTAVGIALDPVQIDLYSLAALLCRWITGESASAFLRSPKVKRLVPDPLQPILERALGLQAEHRFVDLAEFAEALQAADGPPDLPTEAFHSHPSERSSTGDTTPSRLSALPGNDTSVIGPAEGDSPKQATPDRDGEPRSGTPEGIPFATLGHYEIRQRIGHGGMGDVYLGYERPLDRLVAIKVLPAELARDAEFVRRFRVEATAVARLNHPNIVPIHFIGEDQGHHFYAMQFIEGESLADLLARRGKLTVDEALPIVQQTLAGLALAHDHGMVHRDIKPGNILLDQKSRRALLADFGLVKSLGSSVTGKTATGIVMGTVDYISPEQGRGLAVDARSDLYSIGVLLFRMLSGRLPFTADSPTALIFQHVYEQPPSLREINSDVPESLVAVVERLLAKAPDERYQSADELQADLRTVEHGLPIAPFSPRSNSDNADHPGTSSIFRQVSPRNTSLIKAPDFAPDPVLPEVIPAENPRWPERVRDRAFSLFRRHAPEVLQKLQSTERQIDAALAVYQRRQRELARLAQEAESVVAELEIVAESHERAARSSRQRAQTETHPNGRHEAAAAEIAFLQDADYLRRQAAEQAQHLDSIRLNLARVTASLELARNQRDLLNARLRMVTAPSRSPSGSNWKTIATFGAALLAAASLLNLAARWRAQWNPHSPAIVDEHRQGAPVTSYAIGAAVDSSTKPARPNALVFLQSPNQGVTHLVASEDGGRIRIYRVGIHQELAPDSQFLDTVDNVASLAGSPDGKHIAIGRDNGSIAIWDALERQARRELRGHTGRVGALVFSHDGSRLLSGSADGTLRTWDVQSEIELHRTKPDQFHDPTSLAWLPERNRALIGMSMHGAESCRLIDLETSQDIALMPWKTPTRMVAMANDGSTICGLVENAVVVWNASTKTEIRRLPSQTVTAAVSPGERRAILLNDTPATLKDLRLEPVKNATVPEVTLWDLTTGEHLQSWPGLPYRGSAAAYSPDGRFAAIGYIDGRIQLLRLPEEPPPKRQLSAFNVSPGVRALMFSTDGFFGACGDGRGLQIWDFATPDDRRRYDVAAPVGTVAFSSAMDRVLFGTSAPGSRANHVALRVCGATPQEHWLNSNRDLRRYGEGSTAFVGVGFSSDGRKIVTGNADGLVRVWDMQTEKLLQTLTLPFSLNALAISARENGVLIAGQDHDLRYWNWDQEQAPSLWSGHTFHPRSVAVSADGNVAASGAGDRSIRLWNPRSGLCTATISLSSAVNSVALSADGSSVLSGDDAGEVNLWNVETGKVRLSLTRHSGPVRAVALSPSGLEALSAGDDGSVRRWDLRQGGE